MDEPKTVSNIIEPMSFKSVLLFATIAIIITGLFPNLIYDSSQEITNSFFNQ